MKKDKKNKKMKSKRKRRVIFLILLILIIAISAVVYFKFIKKEDKVEVKTKVVDKIDNFDYTISDSDTKLFKEKFKELKEVLSKEEVDNKKYSELISQLFIIDLFTLDNKITKNDIRSVQFVYSNYKTSFIDKTRDEFYKYVKSNLNNDRNQELPIVETIKVESIEKTNASDIFNTDELKNIDEAYKVNLSWTYKKDLGYQKKATVIVVKDNNKFSVAKLMSEETE